MQKELINRLYDIFSIIPLRDKAPILKDWPKYANEKIDLKKVENHSGNIGIVCGYDNLEVIDIDNHFNDADKLFDFVYDNFDLKKFLIIQTQGGGYHIYYKAENIEGNQKLASRKNNKNRNETLIETRGKGGQVVFYNNIVSGTLENVPIISSQDRNDLIAVCKSMNEVERNIPTTQTIEVLGKKPGDIYNEDFASIQETYTILRNHGWTSRDDKHWKRPDKKTNGISATFGKVGKNKFYVFSSNAHPFEPENSYSMFAVKTYLEYNENYSNCAKDLAVRYKISPAPKQNKTKSYTKKNTKPKKAKSSKKWQVLEKIIKDWNLKFRYNELAKVMDVSINKSSYKSLQLLPGDIIREMEVNRGIDSISMTKLLEMIGNKDICEIYNPIKKFFKNLPKWNNKDNIKELCDCIEIERDEKRDFFENMFKKHLARTVSCATIDSDINRMVLVLHGGQEIGKSMLFRWLVPNELYYEEPINPTEKDSILALSRYLIINIDELDSLNKKDVAKLKAYISRGEIVKRVAYGRHDERFPRISSFVASTNKSDILADTTNTRWIILKVKSINWKKYTKEINPLQIWSQAVNLLKENPNAGQLSKDEKTEREHRNSLQFLETSSEREILLKHFTEDNKSNGMTATDIKITIEKELYPIKINLHQLVRELRRLYGEPINTSVSGRRGRFYYISHTLGSSPYENDNYYEPTQETVPF